VQIDRSFFDAENARVDGPAHEVVERAFELVGRNDAVVSAALEQRGEQIGRVDQRFLGRLAVTRIEVGREAVEQDRYRGQVDDEDAEKDARTAGHGAGERRYRSSRNE
jgi:hypothetical protein